MKTERLTTWQKTVLKGQWHQECVRDRHTDKASAEGFGDYLLTDPNETG
jgi:hypothetical protein